MPTPVDASSPDEPVPLGQRLFDNVFLLLAAGLVVMLLLYTGWGLWEITSLPPALDVNHGFSLYPINVNFQVVPGYDYGPRVTPNASGDFRIICNEVCGIGHHVMVGRVIVEDAPMTASIGGVQ